VIWVQEALQHTPASVPATAIQADATNLDRFSGQLLVSTDPPYYDNIGYADLSDYFMVWLRLTLLTSYPDLLRTLLAPKREELVATPYRFKGGRQEADQFFEDGLKKSFLGMRAITDRRFPLTVYYAFKQSETGDGENGSADRSSTGWETMLEGLIVSGFSIHATWPVRTERGGRPVGIGTNALASSIILACRPRPQDARSTTRREFIRELRLGVPKALKTLQAASIAPVDLAQAAIGPGMAIYSRYSAILEPTGDRLRVRTALQLINQVLDEVLAEQDAEHDRDTGWAVAWFEQYGMNEGQYGQAETLAKARNVSVAGMVEAGILHSGRGKVKLLTRDELPPHWDPATEKRLTDWEIAQHLIRELETHGNEGAARLMRRIGSRADLAKDLSYRLYTICERKGWASDALGFNGLVVAWPDITRIAADLTPADYQARLEV
jgi:putative DNA methylase